MHVLEQFLQDERGGLVDTTMSIAILVVVGGGILLTVLRYFSDPSSDSDVVDVISAQIRAIRDSSTTAGH